MYSLFFLGRLQTKYKKETKSLDYFLFSNEFSNIFRRILVYLVNPICFLSLKLLYSIAIMSIRLLLLLLIFILFMLNGIGIIVYRKRRREFLQQTHDDMHLTEIASLSNEKMNAKSHPIKRPMTAITETLENSQIDSISYLCQTNDLSEMDLEIEEFQREALREHNSIRFIYKKPPLKLSESLSIYAQVEKKFDFVSKIIELRF